MKFDKPEQFYFLQILQRKKENPQICSNSRVIKNYYIESEQYLLEHWDEIKTLCEAFNARASIRLNRRCYEQIAFKTLENIANTMQNKEYLHIRNSYDRACGLLTVEKPRTWIVDIDKNEMFLLRDIIAIINACQPADNSDKVLALIPSATGIHLITTAFNTQEFRDSYEKLTSVKDYQKTYIDIHKDNPTNLYIP